MTRLVLVISILGMLACSKPVDRPFGSAGEITKKKISYRGGLVEFSIPSHWQEKYLADGGGEFYEGSGNAGTFRLNVLSFDANKPNRIDAETAARSIAADHNGEIIPLREGNVLARYELEQTENGQPFKFRFWDVYSVVENTQMRIFVFSYGVPVALFNDEKHAKVMEMLESEIRHARFANVLGTIQ